MPLIERQEDKLQIRMSWEVRGQELIRGLKGRDFEEETPDARNFILRRFGECSLNISSIEPQNASSISFGKSYNSNKYIYTVYVQVSICTTEAQWR